MTQKKIFSSFEQHGLITKKEKGESFHFVSSSLIKITHNHHRRCWLLEWLDSGKVKINIKWKWSLWYTDWTSPLDIVKWGIVPKIVLWLRLINIRSLYFSGKLGDPVSRTKKFFILLLDRIFNVFSITQRLLLISMHLK